MLTFGQLFIAVSLPTLVALVGVVLNQLSNKESGKDIKELKIELSGKIDKLESRMDSGFNTMNGHLLHVVEASGTHDGRITALEKRGR